MIDRLKSLIGGLKHMFSNNDIKKITGNNSAMSDELLKNIELWDRMLSGNAKWNKYNPSLGIENGICREFADVTINEMDASVDNEKLDAIFQKVIIDLNENLQTGIALGSMIIKPMMDNTVEFITADKFIPLKFNGDGKLSDVIFVQHKKINDSNHLFRLERHKLENGGLLITNQVYKSHDGIHLGSRGNLTELPEWSTLPEEIFYQGMDKMDFGYYKNPLKNRIDDSFNGVSIYSGKTVDLIRKADKQGARIDWEFESGERAIHVDDRAMKNGLQVAEHGKRLYRGLHMSDKDDLFEDFTPDLRVDELLKGLEAIFRQIEFSVGLSYGDLSNVQYVEKTASEIKIARQKKYNRVKAIQEKLKECLIDLVDAIAFYNAMYTVNHELICTFSDSILSDEESERNQDRLDVNMGVMSLAEYRSKWYGEDLETAQQNLPESTGVIIGDINGN